MLEVIKITFSNGLNRHFTIKKGPFKGILGVSNEEIKALYTLRVDFTKIFTKLQKMLLLFVFARSFNDITDILNHLKTSVWNVKMSVTV